MTAQIHEALIFDGEETSMAFCAPLPEGHPRIVEPGLDEAAQDAHLSISRVIDNRGKEYDEWELGWRNLPGGENRFPGDDEL